MTDNTTIPNLDERMYQNSISIRLQLLNERLDVLEADLKQVFKKQGVKFDTQYWIDADKAGIPAKKLSRLIKSGRVRQVGDRVYKPDILALN